MRLLDSAYKPSPYVQNEEAVAFFKGVDGTGYVPTDVTTVDEDGVQLTKVYIPIYVVNGFYADNTNPTTDEYNTIQSALDALADEPDCDDDYFEPYTELVVAFRIGYVDEDGDLFDESDTVEVEDIDDCPAITGVLGVYTESIATCSFESDNALREVTEDDLRDAFYDRFNNREYDYHGHTIYLNAKDAFDSKYSYVYVVDKDTDETVGEIELRLADHSYNPANNNDAALRGAFVSIVLNDNDPTINKYHGRYNLRYNEDADVEDILSDIDDRFDDILYDDVFLNETGVELYAQ